MVNWCGFLGCTQASFWPFWCFSCTLKQQSSRWLSCLLGKSLLPFFCCGIPTLKPFGKWFYFWVSQFLFGFPSLASSPKSFFPNPTIIWYIPMSWGVFLHCWLAFLVPCIFDWLIVGLPLLVCGMASSTRIPKFGGWLIQLCMGHSAICSWDGEFLFQPFLVHQSKYTTFQIIG